MIRQGNQLHDRLHQQTGQLNCSPGEVCRLLPQLKLRVKTENGFPNQQSLQLGIKKLTSVHQRHATIVIIPPDKSILLAFPNPGNSIVIDTLCHGPTNGAIIACIPSIQVEEYLNNVATKYYSSSACGANWFVMDQLP